MVGFGYIIMKHINLKGLALLTINVDDVIGIAIYRTNN